MLTCCFRFWRSKNQEKVIVLDEISPTSLCFNVFRLENIKPKINEIVNHKNWIVDITRWDIEEMDFSNINSDNFGKHVGGKGKRFTLFCVFKINFLKMRLQFRCFIVNWHFESEILKNTYFLNTWERLLLSILVMSHC